MKIIEEKTQSKPFLKWAGGKTQLLNAIVTRLPIHILLSLQIDRYVEPFIGSGAVFFFLKKHFHISQVQIITGRGLSCKLHRIAAYGVR